MQIEGLKGDDEKEQTEELGEEKEKESGPIDMDDDFNADLEDLKLGDDDDKGSVAFSAVP